MRLVRSLRIRGGTRARRPPGLDDRTRPNVPGVHFYDEPGLTWAKDPETGESTPHGIPAQVALVRSAFGRDPLPYREVEPKNPDHVAHWSSGPCGSWASWTPRGRTPSSASRYVRPDFLSVTQSQYGWSAFTDGYYFNVVRSLPVISGHGGYNDYGPGYFNPSYFLELARARDLAKPNWYLPTWYGNTTADEFRLEQYLSFQTEHPGHDHAARPATRPSTRRGAPGHGRVEQADAAARHDLHHDAGHAPPVAMLYSLSQCHPRADARPQGQLRARHRKA